MFYASENVWQLCYYDEYGGLHRITYYGENAEKQAVEKLIELKQQVTKFQESKNDNYSTNQELDKSY